MAYKAKAIHVFAVVTTIFFFLGWVIFDGYKIEFFKFPVNPFIVIGFGFAFLSILIQYNGKIKKFFEFK